MVVNKRFISKLTCNQIYCLYLQVRFYGADSSTEDEFHTKFPTLRNEDESKQIPLDDYVSMIADGLKLNKVDSIPFYHRCWTPNVTFC